MEILFKKRTVDRCKKERNFVSIVNENISNVFVTYVEC